MGAATVVLVHGAWHGAWCWERIVAGLEAADVPVIAVDLPGHGDSTAPLGDLLGDADHVRSVLDRIAGPVVLVGHSYGGAVITDAGVHPSVAELVYVAAFALAEGETLAAAGSDLPGVDAIDHTGRPDLLAALRFEDDGSVTFDPALATSVFYNDCTEADAAWATERLGPQPSSTLGASPRAVAWRTVPSTYVVCDEDMAVHPELQRLLASRCTHVEELAADHSPFLSAVPELTELLVAAARNVET